MAIDRVKKLDCDLEPKSISNYIINNSEKVGQKRTFGVRVRRISKVGEISSLQYERRIGAEMIRLDSSLSVDLSNPDQWVKLIVDSDAIYQIMYRIKTCGGLPPGVQGDVLVNLVSQKVMLEAFLIMRRGVRLIPVLDSKSEFVEKLSLYDPFIGIRTLEHELSKKAHKRPAWGIIGLTIEQAKPFIGQRKEAVKTTPICSLDPLTGWTEEEISDLIKHFDDPVSNLLHPSIGQWIE